MEESNVFRAILTRRTVRSYSSREIPDDVLLKLLELANRAPSGFNLQPWSFIIVRNEQLRHKLARVAMNQSHVAQAPVTIVFVADSTAWKTTFKSVAKLSMHNGVWDASKVRRYEQSLRLQLELGPWGLLGFLKRLALPIMRLRAPFPRLVTNTQELNNYVAQQTMLAVENLLIGARGFGLDSCVVDEFDEYRIKRLLSIPRSMCVPTLVTVGFAADEAKHLESVRLPVESKTFLDKFAQKFFE